MLLNPFLVSFANVENSLRHAAVYFRNDGGKNHFTLVSPPFTLFIFHPLIFYPSHFLSFSFFTPPTFYPPYPLYSLSSLFFTPFTLYPFPLLPSPPFIFPIFYPLPTFYPSVCPFACLFVFLNRLSFALLTKFSLTFNKFQVSVSLFQN